MSMSTIERMAGRARRPPTAVAEGPRAFLLACGVLAAVHYLVMNIVVPVQWPGYSVLSQTVSELSAVGAPTRPLWVALALLYSLLLIAFGLGIRGSAHEDRRLHIVAWLVIASAVAGLFWPPMHLRGAEKSLTDSLHIAFTGVWLVLTLLTIGFAAAALGRRFRWYSVATLAVFVVFGTLTGLAGPRVAANLPTPWIGLWERINIGAFMLWLAVLSITLLRAQTGRSGAGQPS